MLSSVSWQEFITTVVVLTAVYYLVTVIIFYRKEITHFIKHGRPSVADQTTPTYEPSNDRNLRTSSMMGEAGDRSVHQLPYTSHEASEELSYAPTDGLPDPIGETGSDEEISEYVPVEIISDLLEEIKATCGAITDSVATKEEATALFKALLARFKNLKDTPYHSSINDHIYSVTREPFIVDFSREEIDAFWNDH